MRNVKLKIEANVKVGKDVYLMRLAGDCSEIRNPGEFINLAVPGYFLRRPISVCDFTNEYVDILYKVLGHGTRTMSAFSKGMELDALIGLGNGFTVRKNIRPLLVAGGIGIAPMLALAKAYKELGICPILVYGAASEDDLVMLDVLQELAEVRICTDDGSLGYKGNPVQYLKDISVDYDYYYACGPQVMLKYLAGAFQNGCVSLEARMGCGFGACMGCSIKTVSGPKRVCKEGPVFEASEVIFE